MENHIRWCKTRCKIWREFSEKPKVKSVRASEKTKAKIKKAVKKVKAKANKKKTKVSLRSIKNNATANKIAKKLGYTGKTPAESLKNDFVPGAGQKFNMKYDSKTKQIILVSIKNSSVKIYTGLYIK